MKLVVVSNLAHHRRQGLLVAAWPAPAAEIDALAALFDEVVHVAELHPGDGPPGAAAYRAPNVRVRLLPAAGGRGPFGRLRGLAAAPAGLAAVSRELADADAAYVRCPSRLGFLGALALSAGGPDVRWARYTGEWAGDRTPWGYRLQQRWLRSGLSRLPTAVYGAGDPPDASPWIEEHPNPCLDLDAWRDAGRRSADKALRAPLRLLFVGRLDENKGPLRAVQIAVALRARGWDAQLDLVGDGPLRARVEREALVRLGSAGRVLGALDRSLLDRLYQRAHFLVAPSRTEGWPKVVTEAMAHRAVPVAPPVGALPEMLRFGRAGRLVVGPPAAWADAIETLAASPHRWTRAADEARQASASALIETYISRLRRRFTRRAPAARTAEAAG